MQQASNWPFELLERHVVQHGQLFNCVKIGVKVAGEKHEFYPEEISAHVIKKLKLNAEHWLEQKVSSVVIAVPANFTTGMKEATRNAAVIAGFEPTKVTIVHEPTAAAFAYGVHSGVSTTEQLLLFLTKKIKKLERLSLIDRLTIGESLCMTLVRGPLTSRS